MYDSVICWKLNAHDSRVILGLSHRVKRVGISSFEIPIRFTSGFDRSLSLSASPSPVCWTITLMSLTQWRPFHVLCVPMMHCEVSMRLWNGIGICNLFRCDCEVVLECNMYVNVNCDWSLIYVMWIGISIDVWNCEYLFEFWVDEAVSCDELIGWHDMLGQSSRPYMAWHAHFRVVSNLCQHLMSWDHNLVS